MQLCARKHIVYYRFCAQLGNMRSADLFCWRARASGNEAMTCCLLLQEGMKVHIRNCANSQRKNTLGINAKTLRRKCQKDNRCKVNGITSFCHVACMYCPVISLHKQRSCKLNADEAHTLVTGWFLAASARMQRRGQKCCVRMRHVVIDCTAFQRHLYVSCARSDIATTARRASHA